MTCVKCKSDNIIGFVQVIKGILMELCLDCGYAREPGGCWGFGIQLSDKELARYKHFAEDAEYGTAMVC